MSRLFLAVLVAGLFMGSAASADVPDCDCTTVDCMVSCPAGDATGGQVCVYTEECLGPLVGFECLRLSMAQLDPDSICVCEAACADWPYVYPVGGATDLNGCATFQFAGSALSLGPGGAHVEVCGCADLDVQYRSPDVNADCEVGLSDFVIFGGAFGNMCPPDPSGYQHYTVYTGHCAPCPEPGLGDFVIFASHFGHLCTPGACDP